MFVDRRGGISLKNEAPRRIAAGAFHNVLVSNCENPATFGEEDELDDEAPPVPIKGGAAVFGFGSRRNGILQDFYKEKTNKDQHEINPGEAKCYLEPSRLRRFDGKSIIEVSAGGNVSVFVDVRGTHVWVCGLGTNGRLGLPRPKDADEAIRLLEESGYSPEERKALGYVKKDPENAKDPPCKEELWNASSYPKWFAPAPLMVKLPPTVKAVSISCGMDHTMVLTERGMIYVWGLGAFGNLGTGGTEDCYEPTALQFFLDKPCKAVAAGSKHSLAITVDGVVYSWGHGGNGRLGLGDKCEAALVPTQVEVPGQKEMKCVAAADAHSASIDVLGNMYCWGAGSFGRTGHGEEADAPLVTKVSRLIGTPCVQVELGTHHSIVLTVRGQLFAWGAGEATGLWEKGGDEIIRPKQLVTYASKEDNSMPLDDKVFVQVAAGCFHSFALEKYGELYSWGTGGDGRLGLGACNPEVQFMSDQTKPFQLRSTHLESKTSFNFRGWVAEFPSTENPKELQDKSKERGADDAKTRVLSIHCGGMHSCAVVAHEDKTDIWMWGSSEYGQTGFGEDTPDKSTPGLLEIMQMGTALKVQMLAVGLEHCLMLTRRPNALVFAWGRNSCGQLGLGTNTDVPTPTLIVGVTDAAWVAAGEDHSAVILDSRELYTWGAAEFGKLGHGSGTTSGTQNYPRCVRTDELFKHVNCGSQHTAVLNTRDELLTFGAGWYGRLGHGDMDNRYSPMLVEAMHNRTIVDVQCGAYHMCILTEDRRLWACGRDWTICQPDHESTPKLMTTKDKKELFVELLAVGPLHTLILGRDGKLYGWGDNRNCQLGGISNDSDGRIEFPRKDLHANWPPSSAKVVQLATGSAHSLALLDDGELHAWGLSTGGRLGVSKKTQGEDGNDQKYSKHCKEPAVVDPQWLGGEERDKFDKKRKEDKSAYGVVVVEDKVDPKDIEGKEEKVKRAPKAKVNIFGVLQKKLRDEPEDNLEDALKKDEGRLEDTYRGFINDIWRLWDPPRTSGPDEEEQPGTEWSLRKLQNRLEKSLCRNLKCMGLGDNYPAIKTPIHPDISAKLGSYEELFWVLQQHPCYLGRLSEVLSNNESTQIGDRDSKTMLPASLFMDAVKSTFMRLRDNRTRHLFSALIRIVVQSEIHTHQAKHKEGKVLFDAKTSTVVLLMRFFIEHAYFSKFHDSLFNVEHEDSLCSVILDWTLPDRQGLGGEAKGPGDIQHYVFVLRDEDILEFCDKDIKHMSAEDRQEVLNNKAEEFQKHQYNFISFLGGGTGDKKDNQKKDKTKHHGKHGADQYQRRTFGEWLGKLILNSDVKSVFACIKDFLEDSLQTEESFMKLVEFEAAMLEVADDEQNEPEKEVFTPILTVFVNSILGHLLEQCSKVLTTKMESSLSAEIKARLHRIKAPRDGKTNERYEKEIEKDTKEVEGKMLFNLKQLGVFLRCALNGDFSPQQRRMKELGRWIRDETLMDFVEHVAKDAEDKVETDLTLDLYESHYTVNEITISLKTDLLLHLSNSLWWFQDKVIALTPEFVPQDKLYQVLMELQPEVQQYTSKKVKDVVANIKLRQASEGVVTGISPKDVADELKRSKHGYESARLWPQFMNLIASETAVTHNFTIKSRFLQHYRDLCFCRDCQAPILRSMAPQKQRGRSDLRLIRLYRPDLGLEIGGQFPLTDLVKVLTMKDLPVLKSRDFMSLKYELEECQKLAQDRMSRGAKSGAQKEFAFIAELDKGKEACETMRASGKTLSSFVKLVFKSLEERQEQHEYLASVGQSSDKVEKSKKAYKEQLSNMLESLTRVVQASEEARLPEVFLRKAEQKGVSLKLARVAKINRRASLSKSGHEQNAYMPSATISLGFLRSKQVVAWIQQDFPKNQYKRVSFIFSAVENGDWEVIAMHKEGRAANALFKFRITMQEIERMRCAGKTAKVSYENGWVVINAFSLLQLLARITADAC